MKKKEAFKFDLKKQEKKIFLIFVLSILFYSAFVLFADIKKIISASLSFHWIIVPFILLLTFFNYIFRYFRFVYLLKTIDVELPFSKLFPIFMSGIAMTVTPGKMGEVLKAYLLKKEKNIEFVTLIPILVFERVFDGIAMIILSIGGLLYFRESILFFIFATFLVLGFFIFIALHEYILKLITLFQKRFFHIKILDFAVSFFSHSKKLITFKNIAVSTILGIIAWFFEGLAMYILISQYLPVQADHLKDLLLALFIFCFSSIAGFLVLIPGGVGIAEGSISSLLVLFFHLQLHQAVFLTLIFRFATLWFGVSLGLIFLFRVLKNNKD